MPHVPHECPACGETGWYRGPDGPVPTIRDGFFVGPWLARTPPPSAETRAHERRERRIILVALATPSTERSETVTRQRAGAELACEALIAHGVDTLFGYPGGA